MARAIRERRKREGSEDVLSAPIIGKTFSNFKFDSSFSKSGANIFRSNPTSDFNVLPLVKGKD